MEFISEPDNPNAKKWDGNQSDSGQNSLEYWDYSMELEILNGNPQHDLRIAAELGKTLLEANKTLELELKESLAVNDDQAKEIEYLTKQTAALREANDSRLRIYEHLDDAVQELERTNQRLTAEGNADKKKIKSLLDTIDQLESKQEELHKSLDEAKLEVHRSRNRQNNAGKEVQLNYTRSMSCEISKQPVETGLSEQIVLRERIALLEQKLKHSHTQKLLETKTREELEIDLACQTQDNHILREQLAVYHEREVSLRSIDEELTSLDDSTSLCRKCNGSMDDTGSNYTMQDITDELDDVDQSASFSGDCDFVRMHNGGYAWGSQESLASMGQAMKAQDSPLLNNTQQAQPASLLSELDTQYGLLIEKYKGMVEEHEERDKQQCEAKDQRDKDKVEALRQNKLSLLDIKCQRCALCTCGMVNSQETSKSIMEELSEVEMRPKSLMEELSEVETSSSGFSEGESRFSSKGTQTDYLCAGDDLTPTATVVDLSVTATNEDGVLSQVPEYRRLLHLVYHNVKQVVDKDKVHSEDETTGKVVQPLEVQQETTYIVPTVSAELGNTQSTDDKRTRPTSLDFNSSSRSSSRHRRKERKHKLSETKENVKQVQPETCETRSKSQKRRQRKQMPQATSDEAPRESARCEHKSRKKPKNKSQPPPRNYLTEYSKVTHPSVEVAKLIKLEMTYADVLKRATRPLTHRNQ